MEGGDGAAVLLRPRATGRFRRRRRQEHDARGVRPGDEAGREECHLSGDDDAGGRRAAGGRLRRRNRGQVPARSDKMQEAARGGTVVVDESSMLGLRDANQLFQVAKEKNIKLVLLGDSRQHSSVAAGAVMRVLQQYGGIAPHRITHDQAPEKQGPSGGGRADVRGQDAGRLRPARQEAGLGPRDRRCRANATGRWRRNTWMP